jgi:hypothetical protein
MSTNNHIEKYLDFYCNNDNATSFAVLLKGKWGCGKTHFIKKYIGAKTKFLHISLYGLSSFVEIKEKIIIELLPLIPARHSKIAGNIFRSLKEIPVIKKWIPSDSDDLIIDLFLKGKNGNVVLVFDDLERCDIKIDKLLGYINHLVEFQGQKVVIIANEEAILESDSNEKYRKVKEKLIGKEFSVNSNPDEAINIFSQNIKNDGLKKKSEVIQSLLLKIFKESEFENLRLIEQALSSFDYFYELVESSIKESSDVFERTFYEFVVIFIEYKRGNIKSEDFFGDYPHFFRGLKDEKNHFLDKYDQMSHWITCFDIEILGKILQGISLNVKEQDLLVQKIKEIGNANQESWQKIWHFRQIEDGEFFKNLEDVQGKWDKKEYRDLFVVIHVFGIFLYFSTIGFISKKASGILKEGIAYVDFLVKNKSFPLDIENQSRSFGWKDSAYGLGYHGNDLPEWKTLLEHVDKKVGELKPTFIQEKIKNELLPILRGEKEAGQSLDLLINYNFLHDSSGKGIAFLGYLDANEIKNIILSRDHDFLYRLKEVLGKRFTERKDSISDIETEYVFLQNLKKILLSEVATIEKKFGKQTPKTFLINSFIEQALTPFIPKKKKTKKSV